MGQCMSCIDDGKKEQRKEEERLASAEARAKAAEAAQKRWVFIATDPNPISQCFAFLGFVF